MGHCRGSRGVKRKIRILLDTNMLLTIADGINIFEQIEDILETKPEYIVIKPVLIELQKLASTAPPSIRRKARFALKIVEQFCKVIDDELFSKMVDAKVDDLIVEFALKHGIAVATNDKELRRKLREKGIPEIYLREESMRVDIEGLEI